MVALEKDLTEARPDAREVEVNPMVSVEEEQLKEREETSTQMTNGDEVESVFFYDRYNIYTKGKKRISM